MFDGLEVDSGAASMKKGSPTKAEWAAMSRRLIIALDVDDPKKAEQIIERAGDSGQFYKIGLELLTYGGLDLAQKLAKKKKNVFLDYKLFDIGITVQRAMERILQHAEPAFITVHGDSQTIKSAEKVVRGTTTKILAVSVPTSWDNGYIKDLGYRYGLEGLVLHRTEMALEAGAHGIISSAQEVRKLKSKFGKRLLVVTPGIRTEKDDANDQKRVATPELAISQGADYLVVGRPITKASNAKKSIDSIIDKMVRGMRERDIPFADK